MERVLASSSVEAPDQHQEKAVVLRLAISRYEKLMQLRPDVSDYPIEAGPMYEALAETMFQENRRDDAIQSLRSSIEICERKMESKDVICSPSRCTSVHSASGVPGVDRSNVRSCGQTSTWARNRWI